MQITPMHAKYNQINYAQRNNSFGHEHNLDKNHYTTTQKAIVAGTTLLGVGTSLALLAKNAGYSLKPSKMFSNIKNSYLAKVTYHDEQVIPIGIGTCLGGLTGGLLIDQNKENIKAKCRESIMAIGNIAIPILTVDKLAQFGKKIGGKWGKGIGAVSGIFIGVNIANYLMNKVGEACFKSQKGRGVKATDYSAHVDDMVLASSYISNSSIIHAIGRIIPIALLLPGLEVGMKTSE